MWVLTGQKSKPFSTGEADSHSNGLGTGNRTPSQRSHLQQQMTRVLRQNEEVGTPLPPNRGSSRGIAGWPLRYAALLPRTGCIGTKSFDRRFLYGHGSAQVGFDMLPYRTVFYI